MPFDYSMRISRLTVDKLGVKLYDKVSAVIAELIANAYDADATEVTVRAPMGKYLAARPGADRSLADVEVLKLFLSTSTTERFQISRLLIVNFPRDSVLNRKTGRFNS